MKNLSIALSFVALALLTIFYVVVDPGILDNAVKVLLIGGIVIGALLPLMAALMLFMYLVFNIFKELMFRLAVKIAKDQRLEDTIASYFYFFIEMAPSVSSVSVVAMFVATDASTLRLVIMFFFGMFMRYMGRRFVRAYYDLIRGIQGVSNDRPTNHTNDHSRITKPGNTRTRKKVQRARRKTKLPK